MKIICMDCQTESYSDVEGLKTKKHLTCSHCAEKLQSTPDIETEESALSVSNEDFEFYSNSINEPSSEIENLPPDEEVLDIPETPSLPENYGLTKMDDDVILITSYESKTPLLEGEPCGARIDSTPQLSATADNPDQFLLKPDSTHESTEQGVDSLNQTEFSEESPVKGLGASKKVRLITFSTARLVVIASACVLFIALVEGVITPSPKVSMKAENPTQSTSPVSQEVEPAPVQASTQVPQDSMPAPLPTPAVVESEPIATTPATTQSSEKDKAQFTIQVGSHQDMDEANKQAEKLRAAGFEPRVVSVEIPKRGRWYRVQVGYFNDRSEANRFGSQIVAKGAAENFVVSGL